MRSIGSLMKLPLKFFTDVGAVVNAPSYYPEIKRKCWLRRVLAASWSRVNGDWNPSYNKFGQDVVENPLKGGFVYETTFWKKIISQNYAKHPAFNYAILLRDKCLFWMFMKAFGLPTPEVVAPAKPGHYFLGNAEVDFKAWVAAWTKFGSPLFLKDPTNCCGRGVFKIIVENGKLQVPDDIHLDPEFFADKDFILQMGISNHPELNRLYPKSLNTARFITVWDEQINKPEMFTMFFRSGANGNSVDNWAVGGLLFHVDDDGRLGEYGFFKDKKFSESNVMRVRSHPETGVNFKDFKIPYFKEGYELSLKAHTLLPNVKSIGWDVAFTADGPVLIEGNDDWEISPAQMVNGGLRDAARKTFGI